MTNPLLIDPSKSATYFNSGLFERMQDMHRSWLERLREIRQIESDFGSRLLNAKNPPEAVLVCKEWMTKRLEIVAGEQQKFATDWVGLISEVATSTPAVSATEPTGLPGIARSSDPNWSIIERLPQDITTP